MQFACRLTAKRFLMLKSGEQESAPAQIHVVLNWFDELKRRVSVH